MNPQNDHWNAIDGGVGPVPQPQPQQRIDPNGSGIPGLVPGNGPVTMYAQPGPISTAAHINQVNQQRLTTEEEMHFRFRMDNDTYKILGSLPEMYRNFIINYGIKLASEQEIYQNYLTNFMQEVVDESGVVTQKPKQTKSTTTSNSQPTAAPVAAGGFNTW